MLLRCEKITAAVEVGRLHGVVIQYEGFCIRYVGMHLNESRDRSPTLKMKTARTLILSSAAGLIALSGGAQAADLPVKAKAVEYVRICSLYGAGFFYIPGTEPCIKIGGYLRADTTFKAAPMVPRPGTPISASKTAFSTISFPVRAWR